jgi:hypothetical protein
MIVTDTEIKQKGLSALLAALGEVDAERFITLLNRDPFDYTLWQRNSFDGMTIAQISAEAIALRKKE